MELKNKWGSKNTNNPIEKWTKDLNIYLSAYENVLNSVSYQGNTNQNQKKIPLHTTVGWLESKSQIITSVGKGLEKWNPYRFLVEM